MDCSEPLGYRNRVCPCPRTSQSHPRAVTSSVNAGHTKARSPITVTCSPSGKMVTTSSKIVAQSIQYECAWGCWAFQMHHVKGIARLRYHSAASRIRTTSLCPLSSMIRRIRWPGLRCRSTRRTTRVYVGTTSTEESFRVRRNRRSWLAALAGLKPTWDWVVATRRNTTVPARSN